MVKWECEGLVRLSAEVVGISPSFCGGDMDWSDVLWEQEGTGHMERGWDSLDFE